MTATTNTATERAEVKPPWQPGDFLPGQNTLDDCWHQDMFEVLDDEDCTVNHCCICEMCADDCFLFLIGGKMRWVPNIPELTDDEVFGAY